MVAIPINNAVIVNGTGNRLPPFDNAEFNDDSDGL